MCHGRCVFWARVRTFTEPPRLGGVSGVSSGGRTCFSLRLKLLINRLLFIYICIGVSIYFSITHVFLALNADKRVKSVDFTGLVADHTNAKLYN